MRVAARRFFLGVAIFFATAGGQFALAQSGQQGGPGQQGGQGQHGQPYGVPEIDGPAGISALAFLTGVGLLLYNRYRQ